MERREDNNNVLQLATSPRVAMPLSADFKEALSCWASGVSVVTTSCEGMLYGLTVSSFTSLSLDPPLILVCIANTNRLPAMVEQSGGFAVSILARNQEAASNYFAQSGRLPTPSFTEVEGEWTPSGQPVVKGAMATIVCALEQAISQGDHTILVGRVIEAAVDARKQPLVYFRRSYRTVAEE